MKFTDLTLNVLKVAPKVPSEEACMKQLSQEPEIGDIYEDGGELFVVEALDEQGVIFAQGKGFEYYSQLGTYFLVKRGPGPHKCVCDFTGTNAWNGCRCGGI